MSGGVYGGDDVGALVIDVGHNTVRAGYGGEDVPKLDIPSVVGIWSDSMDDVGEGPGPYNYNIGTVGIHVKHPGMELASFLNDGMIENWDIFENILNYIYTKALGAAFTDHPVLITEPPWVTPPKRERMVELLFEKYNVPALYLGKNAALAAFSTGRPTCLVIDSGASHTSAVPVHDGFVLTQSVVKSPVGGDYISTQCRNYIEEQDIEIIPPYMVGSKEMVRPGEAASWRRRIGLPLLTNSWYNYMVKEVMQDFQTSVVQIAETPNEEEDIRNMPAVHYEFPNGFHKDFDYERYKITESLFNPTTTTVCSSSTTTTTNASGVKSGIQPILGVASLVTTSVGMCDIDIRPTMYGSIVVTGGNTNLQGFTERLNHDLSAKIPPSMRLKVMSCVSPTERRFGAWIGGSILSSLGSFQQLWVSRQEYDEGGKTLVQSKCP